METRTQIKWQEFINECVEEFTPRKPEQPKPILGGVIVLDQLTEAQARLLLEYYPEHAGKLRAANPKLYEKITGERIQLTRPGAVCSPCRNYITATPNHLMYGWYLE